MLPPEIMTILIAAAPIAEVRVSIPFAIHGLGLSPLSAYIFSVIGNVLPAFSIIVIGAVANWLSHHVYLFNRFFAWLFERTRHNHHERVLHWQEFALLILVAIPLPLTGVWTASVVAFVFGIPFTRAFPFIVVGSMLTSLIMLILTLGVVQFFTQ
ncbi:hypothetical protein A3A20_03125 [Candidatus Wolfebacteria bacterium RIFCSPLOWO2_01_FULL_45_19]|uniref:Ligand-binding protein SH3 n=1 Tax=Candidatus Wolfebacteria bacterium RIFCSPLOWO2_01_FULL_45_19 TaxID=1802557 RepID=A0A1F8DSI7_9BACT|nr:MAG: hypothetical protein A3A20_03125 [Candidatus Wolfebacteria bacterium RIFCSPLOWO2_01_FULL_45_19]